MAKLINYSTIIFLKHPAKIIFIDHTHALLQTGQEYGRLLLMAAGVPEEFKNKSRRNVLTLFKEHPP